MKILKVEVENFKPYGKVVLPDDANFGEGLFLIQGNNSMGKSSLIEAMLWGLLGDGLMDVQKKNMLVKTGQSSCKVDITFEIGESQYRIVRKLVLKKSRTPKDEPEFNEDAVLSKKEGGKFVTVINRPNAVSEEVERMLGITHEGIEKTVYVRQKEVDKLALSDPKELRDLVTSLFGLDEFNHVKANLVQRANNIQASIDELRLEVGGLSTEKKELEQKKREFESNRSDLKNKELELEKDKGEFSMFPSEEAIVAIRENQQAVNKKTMSLGLIENKISEKTSYLSNQDKRLDNIETTINNLNNERSGIIKRLQELPPKDALQKSNKILSNIASYEEQIKKQIKRSGLVLDFDPLLAPAQVNQTLKIINEEIELLKTKKEQVQRAIETLKEALTSKEVLSNLKKESVRYIHEKNNCPVCNKPIDDKDKMVSTIDQEIIIIHNEHGSLTQQVAQMNIEFNKFAEQLESRTRLQLLLDGIIPMVDDRSKEMEQLRYALDSISATSIEQILADSGSSSIENLISAIMTLEARLASVEPRIEEQNKLIERERKQYDEDKAQLALLNAEKQVITTDLDGLQQQLEEYLHNLSSDGLDELTGKFECQTIDELLTKRKTLEVRIEERNKSLNSLKLLIASLEADIEARKARIEELSAKEIEMKDKENELRHVKYLRGEVDGFISIYVVEGKMAEALKQAANQYLTPFTDGRYTIDRISSTMRRMKSMESHGLEITLRDGKDNIIKHKDHLSGGDETALGLALRIAISKLMARIRPFKNSERKPPLINSIMMDEPMASLDSSRRRILIRVLTQDKTFRQIFLITHTDIDFGDYHSISVSEDGGGTRKIEFKPMEL